MTRTIVADAPRGQLLGPPSTASRCTRALDRVRGVRPGCTDSEAASSERALVARLCSGDDAAYETLVRTRGPAMLAVARSYLPRQEDAEDVLQSALLLVFRFVHRFNGESKLSTWLHRIVVNCALMRIRSRNRHPEALVDVSALEDDGTRADTGRIATTLADGCARTETRARLLRAVGLLPDAVQAAVRLHDIHGLTVSETATALGRSPSAVKTSIHRGRIALRATLGRGEEFPLSASRARLSRSASDGTSRPGGVDDLRDATRAAGFPGRVPGVPTSKQ